MKQACSFVSDMVKNRQKGCLLTIRFVNHKEEDLMSEPQEKKIIVPVNWEKIYAGRAKRLTKSAIREILKLIKNPEIISFAGGLPANELLPRNEVANACRKILADKKMGEMALQYGPTEGYDPLKEYLVEQMQKYGVPAKMENVSITNGAQGAIFLSGLMLVEKDTMVLVEEPTYLGYANAMKHLGAQFCTIPVDQDGMRVDLLPEIIEKYHPKVIYTMPDFHNPVGVTMSLERRHELARIVSERDDIVIIEDNPYGKLRYSGEHLPPVASLAKEHTFYLGTVSKILAPGLRVGWMVAPEAPTTKTFEAIQGECLYTSLFTQMIVHKIFSNEKMMDARIKELRKVYKERRDVMLDSLDRYFPHEVTWTRPEGGLFLWLTAPHGIDTGSEFFQKALDEKVAYVPGGPFYAIDCKDAKRTARLNFSYSNTEKIEEGMKRLGKAFKKELAKK
jgi:2-aminoadipate transaminase